jgi:hypothetical protein
MTASTRPSQAATWLVGGDRPGPIRGGRQPCRLDRCRPHSVGGRRDRNVAVTPAAESQPGSTGRSVRRWYRCLSLWPMGELRRYGCLPGYRTGLEPAHAMSPGTACVSARSTGLQPEQSIRGRHCRDVVARLALSAFGRPGISNTSVEVIRRPVWLSRSTPGAALTTEAGR